MCSLPKTVAYTLWRCGPSTPARRESAGRSAGSTHSITSGPMAETQSFPSAARPVQSVPSTATKLSESTLTQVDTASGISYQSLSQNCPPEADLDIEADLLAMLRVRSHERELVLLAAGGMGLQINYTTNAVHRLEELGMSFVPGVL